MSNQPIIHQPVASPNPSRPLKDQLKEQRKPLISNAPNSAQANHRNADNLATQPPQITEMERHQLLVQWNDTTTDYPKDTCIYQLFAEQAERTPNAVAIVFGHEQLTYRELNTRVDQLAHHLQCCGVSQGDLVGIAVERSLEMVIGLIATLKAGGAYVPLDPSYPQERLSFMLADTNIKLLLDSCVLKVLRI